MEDQSSDISARLTLTFKGPGGELTRSIALTEFSLDELIKQTRDRVYFHATDLVDRIGELAVEMKLGEKPPPAKRAPRKIAAKSAAPRKRGAAKKKLQSPDAMEVSADVPGPPPAPANNKASGT